jgi:hypothetical protein
VNAPLRTADVIGRRLVEQGDRYLPDLGGAPVSVRLRTERRRPASDLYVYELAGLSGAAGGIGVVAKVANLRSRSDDGSAEDRFPRFSPPTDARTKQELEHHAMTAIQSNLERLGDPGLFPVRVLGRLPELGVLLLEDVPFPTLRQRLLAAGRAPRAVALRDLDVAVGNAGRWLAALHAMTPPAHAHPRRRTGAEVAVQLLAYVRHLADAGVASATLRRVGDLAERGDRALFPSEYPVVWSHGDFAPRNLFVDPTSDAVAGFDVLGRWVTPHYEDLAYFLTALSCSRAQVLSQGTSLRGSVRRPVEQRFLDAYGDRSAIPLSAAALRGYQLLVLLDRWSRLRSDGGDTPLTGPRRRRRPGVWAIDRYCRRLARELLDLGGP